MRGRESAPREPLNAALASPYPRRRVDLVRRETDMSPHSKLNKILREDRGMHIAYQSVTLTALPRTERKSLLGPVFWGEGHDMVVVFTGG